MRRLLDNAVINGCHVVSSNKDITQANGTSQNVTDLNTSQRNLRSVGKELDKCEMKYTMMFLSVI